MLEHLEKNEKKYDKPEITGCRIVRFTNASSGYPCYRFDAYIKTNKNVKTFSGQCGDNVERFKTFVTDGIVFFED